jgi:hypothetical protein
MPSFWRTAAINAMPSGIALEKRLAMTGFFNSCADNGGFTSSTFIHQIIAHPLEEGQGKETVILT